MAKVKVKMKTSMSASTWALHPGDETEVDENIAKVWQERGFAEVVKEKKIAKKKVDKKETATSKKKVEKRDK